MNRAASKAALALGLPVWLALLSPSVAAPEQVPRGGMSYGAGKVAKPEFKDLVRRADVILRGKVIQIGGIPHPGPSKQRPKSKRYTYWEDSYAILQVEDTIKGKPSGAKVRIAYHSDMEGDQTRYQAGKHYLVFLLNPGKYPDAYTTAGYHFGQYKIDEQGKAERVNDPSEMSKPVDAVIENIHKAKGNPKSAS